MALIKQCKSCNKKGLFLKLEKGLCFECKSELNFLEKQYDYIESVLDGSVELSSPDEIIKKANLIINTIHKFYGTYTPIDKELCLKAINIMKNLEENQEESLEEEPILMDPSIYENKFIDSSEVTLKECIDNSIDESDLIEKESTLVVNSENISSNINLELVEDENSNSVEDLYENNTINIEEKSNKNNKLKNIIEDTLKTDFTESYEKVNLYKKSNKELIKIDFSKDNEDSFNKTLDNIIFEEELFNIPEEKIEKDDYSFTSENLNSDYEKLENAVIDSDIPVTNKITSRAKKEEISQLSENTLDKLKALLSDLEHTNTNPTKNKLDFSNIIEPKINFKYTPEIKKIIRKDLITETKVIAEDNLIENKELDSIKVITESIEEKPLISTETLAQNLIDKLNTEDLTPEKTAYNIALLKTYTEELKKDSITIVNNTQLDKFIQKKECDLIKLANKKFKLSFSFFNYIAFDLIENSPNEYTLSALKICYGEIIDTFYSKYTTKKDNFDLDFVDYTAQKFLDFIGDMTLVTHNSNYTLTKLKKSFSVVKKPILNHYICTKNNYTQAHLMKSGKNPTDISIDSAFNFFYKPEELNSLNLSTNVQLLNVIKIFKLHEKIKYILKIN